MFFGKWQGLNRPLIGSGGCEMQDPESVTDCVRRLPKIHVLRSSAKNYVPDAGTEDLCAGLLC